MLVLTRSENVQYCDNFIANNLILQVDILTEIFCSLTLFLVKVDKYLGANFSGIQDDSVEVVDWQMEWGQFFYCWTYPWDGLQRYSDYDIGSKILNYILLLNPDHISSSQYRPVKTILQGWKSWRTHTFDSQVYH